MTGFINDTNAGRIAKMRDTVALLAKSAKSNKAPTEEIREVFAPLIEALDNIGAIASSGAAPEPEPSGLRQDGLPVPDHLKKGSAYEARPTWVDVRQMCEEAPLEHLTVALAVYMNRVDDALRERGRN